MSASVDVYASQPHYVDHLEPIVRALGEEACLCVTGNGVGRAEQLGLAYEQRIPRRPTPGPPVLVAGYRDAREIPVSRRLGLLEHGSGQAYCDTNRPEGYPGGPGWERASLILTPGPHATEGWQRAYPYLRVAEVGSPRLDRYFVGGVVHGALDRPAGTPHIVAFTFHWECRQCPETWPAFADWRGQLAGLPRDHWEMLGHWHPRWGDQLERWYEANGITTGTVDDVMDRADLLVADNTCVLPSTPVLCADLTWRAADELRAGDQIIACDEEATRPVIANGMSVDREDRRFRTATVLANTHRWLPCVTVRTTQGELTTSNAHPWLARRSVEHRYTVKGRKPRQRWNHKSRHWHWEWVEANALRPGDDVAHFAEPWATIDNRQTGWLAGMFDGEGTLYLGRPSKYGSRRSVLSVAQNDGPVLDELRRVLADEKVSSYEQKVLGGRGLRCIKLTIGGTLVDLLRIIGTVRPVRLLAKAMREEIWRGANVSAQVQRAQVLSVHSVGVQKVATLTTSESTFVAGGFLAHNSMLYEFAATGRPVLCLNAERWRRDVEQGLRFWSHVPGLALDPGAPLVDGIDEALRDDAGPRALREQAAARVYGRTLDGRATERAVAVIREWA